MSSIRRDIIRLRCDVEQILDRNRITLTHMQDQVETYGNESACPIELINSISAQRTSIAEMESSLQKLNVLIEAGGLDIPPTASSLQATETLTVVHIQQPPKRAEYFLYYLPQKDRDEVIGDLEEEYQTVYKRFGPEGARRWYWWQVAFSFWPYFKAGLKSMIKWSTIGWVSQLFRLGLEYLRHFV